MSPLLVLIAAASLGVEVGWQPLSEGGHEYTIQLEPQLLEVLKSHDIVSEVPPNLEIRRYRITIGSGKLARIDGPSRAPSKVADTASAGDHHDQQAAEGSTAEPTPAKQSGEPTRDDPFRGSRTPTLAAGARDEEAPAALPPGERSKPLEDASGAVTTASAQERNAEKPTLDGPRQATEPERPWTPLLTAGVLLCVSLGANLYLGWIAWEARSRYRQAMAKMRPAAS